MTVILDKAFMESLDFILSHDFSERDVAQHLIEHHTVYGGLEIAAYAIEIFTDENNMKAQKHWENVFNILFEE